jgi:hypothetical protein
VSTLLIIGLTASVVAGLGYLTVRQADAQLAVLAQVASAMKLSLVRDRRRARGVVRTHPESEGMAVRVTALGSADSDCFAIECLISPPLRMGLEVASKAVRTPWASYWDPQFGEPSLHEAFSVSAQHADQVEQLLSGWILRELVRARGGGFSPRVTDYSVSMRVTTGFQSQLLTHAIERTVRLAEGLVHARVRLPPSALERTVERAFQPVARRFGGRLDRSNLALHVEDDAGKLSVFVEHVRGSAWQTLFEFQLERRLARGIRLADTQASSLYSRWIGPDIRIGDDAFDAAFVVRCEREDAVRSMLTVELRAALLALRGSIEGLTVDDGRVSGRISGVVSDAGVLERAVQAMLMVGEAMVATRRGRRSAYR